MYQQADDWIGIQWTDIILGSIRRIDSSTHKISTLAVGCDPPFEKLAASDCIESIGKIRVARSGKLLISEYVPDDRVRSFDPTTRQFSLIADNGGPGIAEEPNGNILITSSGGYVRRVDVKTGIISTVAGTVTLGRSGDGGPALAAQFEHPTNLAVDRSGNIYIEDNTTSRIRRVDAATGLIETVVGQGNERFSGEGGPAKSAHIGIVNDLGL